MAAAVYILGALVSLTCGVLLVRAYGRVRKRLLLWSGICFLGLAVSNCLTFLDLIVLPTQIDLYVWRLLATTAAMLVLLYGLIWEGDR